MSPALGAPTAQRRQTQLRFEGRLGLSGLPPPEFGSPTGGLSPCHGSQALCRPERRLRRLPAIGPLASANRSPWLQELIRHYTRIYCCLPPLKIETRRYRVSLSIETSRDSPHPTACVSPWRTSAPGQRGAFIGLGNTEPGTSADVFGLEQRGAVGRGR